MASRGARSRVAGLRYLHAVEDDWFKRNLGVIIGIGVVVILGVTIVAVVGSTFA
jgi:hypothetical protein